MWAKQYLVYKIGGSILRNYSDIRSTVDFLVDQKLESSVIVVSAVKGITDLIIDMCRNNVMRHEALSIIYLKYMEILDKLGLDMLEDEVTRNISRLEKLSMICGTSKLALDEALSFGELTTSRILYSFLSTYIDKLIYLDHREIGIVTSSEFNNSKPLISISRRNIVRRLKPLLDRGYTAVIPGFIGIDRKGRTTTMGRGASDLSASLVAYSIDSRELYFITDTSGILSIDPKVVRDPKPVKCLDLEEAEYASRYRVKGIHPLAFKILKKYRGVIKIIDRHGDGTIICSSCHEYGPKILVDVDGYRYIVIGRNSKGIIEYFDNAFIDLGLKVSKVSDIHIEFEAFRKNIEIDKIYRAIFK